MKSLCLLRHAAAASDPDTEDYERPLSALGRRQAEAMARHMRETQIRPQAVLCSAALRGRQTWELIAAALEPGAGGGFDARLYMASIERLVERIGAVPEGAASALVIGHNPGLQQLANWLAGDPPRGIAMPPCALAVLTLSAAGWRNLGRGDAELTALCTPRDLGL